MDRYLIKKSTYVEMNPPAAINCAESSGSSIDSPDDNKKKRKKKQSTALSTKRFSATKELVDTSVSASSSSHSLSAAATCSQTIVISKQGKAPKITNHGETFLDVDTDTDNRGSSQTVVKSSKEKKKKSYTQKFKEEWKHKYDWLEMKTHLRKSRSYCKACCKIIKGGKSQLDRHESTEAHKSDCEKAKNTAAIKSYLNDDQGRQSKNREKSVKSAEIKMVMFLQEHNLPFLLMDHLPKFIASVCPDSEVAKAVKCGRTKAKNLTDCIAEEQISQISDKLKETFYSLIVDETTDIGTKKCLAVVARYYDNSIGQCRDSFLGLIKVASCTAEDLFNAIIEHLKNLGIPIKNMIGFAADNASVMMGNIRGVQARFKQILPHLFVMGCVCHSAHLCSSAAAQKLPKSIEEMVRSIYKYFSHSSNRVERLQEFQSFVNLKPHKLLHPSQTRWLSVQAAVDRVLENWDALILFFTHECFEDDLPVSQMILSQLKSPCFKIYFTFLSHILETVNRLNIEFQAEKPKLHLLLTRVRDLYRNILRNFLKKDYLDQVRLQVVEPSNPRNFIPLDGIYFGAKTELLIKSGDIDAKEIHTFKTHALSFYVTLAEQIKKRFDFENPTLIFVRHFNPKTVLAGETPSIASDASKLFPMLIDDIERLDSEWRLLPDLAELQAYKNESMEEFWKKVFDMSNELKHDMFPNLSKFVKGLLCLPHSSAAAERVFSQLTLMKNKTRNRLNVETCENILHAKEMLGKANTCHTWEPTESLLKRKPKYD